MLIEVSLIYDVVLVSGVISSFQSEQGTLFPKDEIAAGFPWWGRSEESTCQCRMERKWHPTPVFLPGESQGQRGAWWAAVHGVTQSWT